MIIFDPILGQRRTKDLLPHPDQIIQEAVYVLARDNVGNVGWYQVQNNFPEAYEYLQASWNLPTNAYEYTAASWDITPES